MFGHQLTLLIFTFIITRILSQNSETLQTVQILFRHGQRAPNKIVIFPTEDPKLLEGFPTERGELTNDGIMQEYQLGQTIRKTYDKFIGKRYIPSNLFVLTGADNRTITSALAVLASLFPPQDDQVWKEFFNWQPIAIHTEPILDKFAFGGLEQCPVMLENAQKDVRYNKIIKEDLELKDWLTNMTGINVSNPLIYNQVIDTLLIRANLKQLPPPIWARDETAQQVLRTKQDQLNSQVIDIILEQTGGWLFNRFVEAIENRINQTTNHTLILYSAHDTNIQTMAKLFSLPQYDFKPSFGSHIALEHHLKNGNHTVELWFHFLPAGNRTKVSIPGCSDPCLFESFKMLKPRISSSSLMFSCEGEFPFCDDYSVILSVMFGLTILLGILTVLLIFVCCAYRHRLDKLLDPERQRLLDK